MLTGSAADEHAEIEPPLARPRVDQRLARSRNAVGVRPVFCLRIMDCFGAGGSFTEYYAMDHRDDVVLMGHDGPGHIAIAQGKTKVRPLKVEHGKVGRALSVEMSVKHRPVTLFSMVQTADGWLKLLVAEGESVPGPILEIGNTNSRYRFSIGARKFVESWYEESKHSVWRQGGRGVVWNPAAGHAPRG